MARGRAIPVRTGTGGRCSLSLQARELPLLSLTQKSISVISAIRGPKPISVISAIRGSKIKRETNQTHPPSRPRLVLRVRRATAR